MEEKELIEKILAGKTSAFRLFIESNKKLVAHIVFRMVHNVADREDLCQEVFLRAFQNLSGFSFQSKLSTWLARIAYNTCINYLEKHKVALYEDFAPEDHPLDAVRGDWRSPAELTEFEERKNIVLREIERIPIRYRTILTLYHLDEKSYQEIAEITDLPEGTVKNYLFRARQYLKDRLVKIYDQEELYP